MVLADPPASRSPEPAPETAVPTSGTQSTPSLPAASTIVAPPPSAAPTPVAPTPTPPAAPTPSAAPAPVAPKTGVAPVVPQTSAAPTLPPSKNAEPVALEVTGAFKIRWDSLGGSRGALGKAVSEQTTKAPYSYQEFAGGFIYSHPQYGVNHIIGSSAIGKVWNAGGKAGMGEFGFPISAEYSSGDGTYQKFSNNFWIFTTGHSINLQGDIARKWLSSGGLKAMGAPIAAQVCKQRDNGCFQTFKKATIFWSAKSGAQASLGGILGRYQDNGALAGRYGYPIGPEVCGLAQKGCAQNFQNGLILWSRAAGAHGVLSGAIRTHYGATGTTKGYLEFPVAEEVCAQKGGGCSQKYQGGSIYWSPASKVSSIRGGKLADGYSRRDGLAGVLGYPKAQQVCGQPNGGCYQDFQNGRLWSNNAHTSAYVTKGGIGSSFVAKGGPRSFLGYPISDERCSGGNCVQTFVGGHVAWGPGANGSYAMSECQNLNNGKSRYSSGGSKHVLLTFTQRYGQSYASNVYCKNIAGIYVTEWKTDGYVGKSGFKAPGQASGPTRYEFSPTGSYTVSEAFGMGNPGTKLPYRKLKPSSRWGGNPNTPTYNKYFESNSWVGYDENMWYFATRSTRDYGQGVVINYNRPNIVQNAGFAIFLHQNKVPTAGCIALDNWAVVDYVRKSVPGDRVIMGVKSAIFK